MLSNMVLAAVLVSTVHAITITVTTNTSHVTDSISQGDDVILNCAVTSEGAVDRLVWLKDDVAITDNVTYKTDARGMALFARLFLANVKSSKTNGKYECRSWQSNSTHSKAYQLRVDEPPDVQGWPIVMHVSVGDRIALTCEVLSGWPIPDIQWLLPTGKVIITQQNTKLFLNNLTKTDDMKKWVCKATNRAGVDTLDFYVVVDDRPVVQPPEITSQQNRKVQDYQGNSASFEIKTRFTPESPASYQWYFGGRALVSDSKYTIRPQFIRPHNAVFRMTINNLTQEDTGTYKLIVQTHIAPQAVDYTHLEVFVKAEINPAVHDISALRRNVQFVGSDSSVTLQCQGRAPYRQLKWIFHGVQLNSTKQSKYDIKMSYQDELNTSFRFILKISNPGYQDIGWYTCAMITREGLVKAKIRLQEASISPPHIERSERVWIQWTVVSSILLVLGVVLIIFSSKRCRKKSFKLIQGVDTSNETPKFDLFISYSSSDFEWVSKHLIPLLEKHELLYSIHHKDFEIGKTIVDNMADSVYLCKHVVAVVSERYLESKFCREELDMAIGRTSLAKKQLLTVIKLDAMPTKALQKYLKGSVYCQTVEKDDEWKDKLMKHLLPLIKMKQFLQL